MPLVKIQDRCGKDLEILQVNGNRFPYELNEETILSIPRFCIRDDDVIICAYQRSGSHWVWEMTNMLLQGKPETLQKEREGEMLEYTAPAQIDKLPSPRLLGAHLKYEDLPVGVMEKKIKIIYLIRDPRDVAVSWYKLCRQFGIPYEGSWDEWFPLFLEGELDWGCWMEHILSWERTINQLSSHDILVMHYEDMKEDTALAVQRISDFLSLKKDPDLWSAIAEKCSFRNMKKDKLAYTSLPGGVPVHYRKGVVGDWVNMFTDEQTDLFQEVYTRKMQGSKFMKRYSYPKDKTTCS